MKSFFESMKPWRKPEGSLHLYLLPKEEDKERFMEVQDLLRGIEHLPLMPAAYLHCTVARLAQFDEDVTQAEYTSLGDDLEELCSGLSPVTLQFHAPLSDDLTVACLAAPSWEWKNLARGCQKTVAESWGMDTFPPPATPHVSLAYAMGSVDEALVAARLAESQPLGAMSLSTLHLVSVTVRPQRGTFDFTELANWDLGS